MNKILWHRLSFVLFTMYIIALLYLTVFSNQYLRLQEDYTPYFKLTPSIFELVTADESLIFKLKNLLGNIILFLPFGFLLPVLLKFQKKFVHIITVSLMGGILSVAIELVQVYFAYRIFDIDDIILNTVGTSTGFVLFFFSARKLQSTLKS